MPGYQIREEQRQAIGAITAAFAKKNGIALIEAGTGVGKTLAYLIPSLLHARPDRKVIISTHTLALQAQLWERDIPLVQSLIPRDVTTAIMKGRSNYLCLQDLAIESDNLINIGDPLFDKLRKWSRTTETGDIAELPFNYPAWSDVRADIDTCRGKECRLYDVCFYYKARRDAEEASVVLVNHALLLSDIAIKRSDPEARVLPNASFIVLDEAHHIEDVASSAFGVSISSFRIPTLVSKLQRFASKVDIKEDMLKSVEGEARLLFEPFVTSSKPEYFLDECAGAKLGDLKQSAAHISLQLAEVESQLGKVNAENDQNLKERIEGLQRQISRVREEMTLVFFGEDENFFRWGSTGGAESRAPIAMLSYTPVLIAPFLRDTLFAQDRSAGVGMTSATLSTSGDFRYLRSRLGIDPEEEAAELIVYSPFSYGEHCLFYIPRHFPPPSDSEEHMERVAQEMIELISASRGGAFLLFTSHRMLRRVYDYISNANLPFLLLRQGDKPTGRLAQDFREAENAVLFGTQSFWEGVDIPGNALRLVVIDKLPFAMPESPINKARIDAIKASGGDWFRDGVMPQAQLKLKQGFGRLIRTSTDRGVVAILDSRLVTKNYGYQFIRHLPQARRTFQIADVEKFFEQLKQPD
jgi:ATP-dependent DNA helicase DinG